jgi:peroxiredoxin
MRSRSLPWFGLALTACMATALGDDAPPPAPAPAPMPAEERARVDTAVRDFRLKDVMVDEERFVTLSELKGKTVVLFFVSDKCQVSWLYEVRTGKLIQDFKERGVVFLGVRSSAGDSAREIRTYCEAKNFDIPVLFDDGNVVADYFGVRVTPQYAVIGPDGVLRYFGAFDDIQTPGKLQQAPETAQKQYVRDALEAVLGGREVETKEARGYG